jgi:molybdopterin synthase catalytic subunit
VFAIVRDPIDPQRLERIVRSSDGGVVTFLGVVRQTSPDGRPVTGLFYEAFDAMAIREFERIAGDARDRFGDVALAIVHRVGELRVGEISVAVLAAAPHRSAAFDACRYAIGQLKSRAAIWKQERYASGDAAWISVQQR